MSLRWDKRMMELARAIGATFSKDRSTKIGAVIVDELRIVRGIGYNGMPRGVNDDCTERHARPLKYLYVVHAEQNALNNATGSVRGSTMYVEHFPCSACARSIIQAGIKRVVTSKIDTKSDFYQRWATDIQASKTMFREASIAVQYMEREDLLDRPAILEKIA